MSECSLDSLENYSSNNTKVSTRPKKGRGRRSDNLEDSSDRIVNDPFDLPTTPGKLDEGIGFNEWLVPIGYQRSEKFSGNAIIPSSDIDSIEFCSTKEKAVVTLGGRTRFCEVRNVPKKFDVPRRSLSSSTTSASEFRLPCTRKSPNDVGRFMKFDKKLGNVQTATAHKGKKSVSYLDLYRRKFASVERSRPVGGSRDGVPVGSTLSICDDRSDERPANLENSATVSRDDQSELDFYRRVIEFGSRGSRETRSCEALDRSAVDERVSKSTDDVSRCYSDSIQPVNRGRRVSYKPYSIEDYRSLSVPQPDRSLGPDRIEIESKGQRLMRRRSYGDSVSARNRQRILRYAQKLKQSRRADAQKLPLSPLTDLQHHYSASKIVEVSKQSEDIPRTEISSRSRRRKNKQNRAKKCKHKEDTFSDVTDLWENSNDTLEDIINLRILRQRHLDEKKKIDLILKLGT